MKIIEFYKMWIKIKKYDIFSYLSEKINHQTNQFEKKDYDIN